MEAVNYQRVLEKEFSSTFLKGYKTDGSPDFKKGSGVLKYLKEVCICDPMRNDEHPNFFDGEVLAHIKYEREREDPNIFTGPFNYKEKVKVRWQPASREPSSLFKTLTETFHLRELNFK